MRDIAVLAFFVGCIGATLWRPWLGVLCLALFSYIPAIKERAAYKTKCSHQREPVSGIKAFGGIQNMAIQNP